MKNTKLFIGNLDYNITSQQLETFFANYGHIKEAKVIEGKGFGFVEYSTDLEAVNALEALDGYMFEGRKLRINEARSSKK